MCYNYKARALANRITGDSIYATVVYDTTGRVICVMIRHSEDFVHQRNGFTNGTLHELHTTLQLYVINMGGKPRYV